MLSDTQIKFTIFKEKEITCQIASINTIWKAYWNHTQDTCDVAFRCWVTTPLPCFAFNQPQRKVTENEKKLMYLPSLLIAISFLFHNQAAKGTESIGQLVFVMHHSWSKSYSTKVCICMYRSVHQQRTYTPENTIVGYTDIFSGRKCV